MKENDLKSYIIPADMLEEPLRALGYQTKCT